MVRLTLTSYVLILLYSCFGCAFASRILGVFPHHGLSHFKVFEPLMLELAKRGHEVTVISRYPHFEKIANYTDIDVNNEAPFYNNVLPFHALKVIPMTLYHDLTSLYTFLAETEDIFHTKNFKNFLKEKPKYDLMIVETFNSRLFLALSHVLQVPFITLSSHVLFPHASYDIANPINPAYIPSVASYHSNYMNFWQRLDNFLVEMFTIVGMELFLNAKAEELKSKYLGDDIPPLREIAKNTSLTLVNSYFQLNGARPFVPGIIEVGGMFVKPAKPLPQVFFSLHISVNIISKLYCKVHYGYYFRICTHLNRRISGTLKLVIKGCQGKMISGSRLHLQELESRDGGPATKRIPLLNQFIEQCGNDDVMECKEVLSVRNLARLKIDLRLCGGRACEKYIIQGPPIEVPAYYSYYTKFLWEEGVIQTDE